MKTWHFLLSLVLVTTALFGAFYTLSANQMPMPWHTNTSGNEHQIVVYKSPTCGCCGNHVTYLSQAGYKVEAIDVEDMDVIKKRYDIPAETLSCHTAVINDGQYFIEGHIPSAAYEKILEEEPDIRGIGMPGMPHGSPGMPGVPEGPFDVMQVDNDNNVSHYMSI